MNLFIVFATIAIAFALGFLTSALRARTYTNKLIESHQTERHNEYMAGHARGWAGASEDLTTVKANYFRLFPVIHK